VRALAARSPDLLGRAKRSSPKAARLRAAGAGLDGESADQAIIMSPRCASSSDTVREIEYQILQLARTCVLVVRLSHRSHVQNVERRCMGTVAIPSLTTRDKRHETICGFPCAHPRLFFLLVSRPRETKEYVEWSSRSKSLT
jgi:hypothetical protein